MNKFIAESKRETHVKVGGEGDVEPGLGAAVKIVGGLERLDVHVEEGDRQLLESDA